MHFGTALRLFRTDAGINLGDLARRIGVSAAYLSRVEHGHDPAPTPDRLIAIARALDLPPLLLIELAAHTGAALAGYLEEVPSASALFLDIARRRLSAAELARVQQFISDSFPDKRALARPPRLSELMEPSAVAVGVTCDELEDAVEVAVSRWDLGERLSGVEVVDSIIEREKQASSAIGSGVVVPHAVIKGAPAVAALVTLRRPLALPAPDQEPIRLVLVLLLPASGRRHLETLAQAARLASRGIAGAVASIRDPERILAQVAALEAL
jgi:PTS system nitrogen regulatory IIA component